MPPRASWTHVGGADRSVRSVVPADVERLEAPAFAAHMWSATTATTSSRTTIWRTPLSRLRLAVVDADHLAADHRAGGDGGDLHSRQLDIDPVLVRGPIHLAGGIEPLGRRADSA